MKKILFLGLLLIHLPAGAVEKGAARNAVLAELGEPNGSMQRDGKEILLFKTGTVTLQNGIVIGTDLSQNNVRQAEERATKAKEIRAARQAELEQQKRFYPEDRVTRIDCTYSKTESWEFFPESIRPAQGTYRYDIYIPPGYHEIDERLWKCLFLESPALWNSVKERARSERWIVVILPDAVQPPVGKTMNGNFLAAMDDATGRFRIAKEHLFTVGKIPAALFAVMRPVAGIILQEPDFRGFEKTGFYPDLLRLNSNLRAYVLLGNSDRNNVLYQGKFIVDRIPKHYVGIYEGSTAILPKQLADQALDWMKKEYALP